MNENHGPVADELRQRLKLLLWATIILYVVVIVIGSIGFWINHQQNSKTHHALCTFRDDLQRRVDSTKTYLFTHPQGIPGISRATLTKSIRDQTSTIEALSSLNCAGKT